MGRRIASYIVVIALVVLAGCSTLRRPATPSLSGEWKLSGLEGARVSLVETQGVIVGEGYTFSDIGPNHPFTVTGSVSGFDVDLTFLTSEGDVHQQDYEIAWDFERTFEDIWGDVTIEYRFEDGYLKTDHTKEEFDTMPPSMLWRDGTYRDFTKSMNDQRAAHRSHHSKIPGRIPNVSRVFDRQPYVGSKVLVKGEVSNTRIPQVKGIDVEQLGAYRGKRIEVVGELESWSITEEYQEALRDRYGDDSYADLGTGTFYRLTDVEYKVLPE